MYFTIHTKEGYIPVEIHAKTLQELEKNFFKLFAEITQKTPQVQANLLSIYTLELHTFGTVFKFDLSDLKQESISDEIRYITIHGNEYSCYIMFNISKGYFKPTMLDIMIKNN